MVTANYSKGVKPKKLLQENFQKRGNYFRFFLLYFQKKKGEYWHFFSKKKPNFQAKLIFEQRK